MILIVVLYFLPSIVAIIRNHNVGLTVLINFFLGWTIIGWFGAMLMCIGPDRAKPVYVVNVVAIEAQQHTPLQRGDFTGARKLIPRG
jgi:hypothetical protein